MSSGSSSMASPSPLGLVALSIACFIFFAYLTGIVDEGAYLFMGMALIGGFIAQIIVGVLELNDGNLRSGNLFSIFAIFLMLMTGLNLIIEYFAGIYGWEIAPVVIGWAWIPLAITLLTWMPAYFKGPFSLLLLVIVLVVAVAMVCLLELKLLGTTGAQVAGYLLLIGGLLGLYNATAVVLNGTFEKQILPTGSPLVEVSADFTSRSYTNSDSVSSQQHN